jgi:hypothetical protein
MTQEMMASIGHNGGPALDVPLPSLVQGRSARITRCERPVTTAGRARTDEWVLRFERSSAPYIEPLMGWTGGDDTLASQVELTFRTRAEAIAYAERYGLDYRVVEGNAPAPTRRVAPPAPGKAPSARPARLTEIWGGADLAVYGRCELPLAPQIRRRAKPATTFATPWDVVHYPLLTLAAKRQILVDWAHDELLKEVAVGEGMPEGPEPSRLSEVRAALSALNDEWQPGPAAPAARPLDLAQEMLSLAA